MGKGNELIHLLKTGNSGEARKLVAKIKKQGKKKFLSALSEQDEEGCTALHYCACYNFLDFIEEFIEVGAVVNAEDNKGATPLHMAATNGRSEAISILLRRGADPNMVNRSGDSPLHLSSQHGHCDVVEYLVKENAKCTLMNVSGQTALDLASQNGHTNVVTMLLRSNQFNPQKPDTPYTSLKLASKHGHTQVLSILIRHGFDVNRVLAGAHGTCLHEASLYGKIEAVHYLLQCGADPSIKNSQGLTPLDIVNHYTDPRSAHQLKQLLQDALANQARQRIAQTHKSQAASSQQQMYSQYYQQQQQQQQQHMATGVQQPHGGQTHSQYQGQPHSQYQGQTHSQYQGQPHSQYQGQPHSQYQGQPHSQYQGQPHSQYQGQTHSQYQGQTHSHQGQTHSQSVQPRPGGVAMGGSPDLASLIAAKAASRKPLSSSPSNKDQFDHMRSSTMAGMQRPQIDKAAILKRRSYEEGDNVPPSHEYHHSNPPTLPRRHGPPTFKPVPPPTSPSPGSPVPVDQPPVIGNASLPLGEVKLKKTTPRPPPSESASTGSPVIGNAALPLGEVRLKKTTPRTHSESGPESPVIGNASLPLGEVRLKKTAPKAPPPKEEPASFDNELLSKLKRRQETIDQPAPPPDQSTEQTTDQITPPTIEPVASVNQSNTLPSSSSSPPKPIAPKPKPKPSKGKKEETPPPAPPPADAVQPQPTKVFTWQDEIAKRKEMIDKQEEEERIRREEEKKREEEERIRREEEEKRKREQERIKREEEERLKKEQEIKKKVPPPVKPKEGSPRKSAVRPPSSSETSGGVVLPSSMIGPGGSGPPSVVLPLSMIGPGTSAVTTATPLTQPVAITAAPITQPVTQPVVAPVTQPVPQPVVAPVTQPVVAPVPQPVVAPVPQPVTPPVTKVPEVIETASTSTRSVREFSPKDDERPSTPSSTDHQMSRSTSVSSMLSATLSTTMAPFECLPISEWLVLYKLPEYINAMEANGYDNTDFLLGVTSEELAEIGVSKLGHRKRLLGALGQLIPKEHFLTFKPASVAEWLQLLGLSTYESVMIDSGYDDIDFITSINEDELLEIGINKKGHLKRFKKGISELIELQKADHIPLTPAVLASSHVLSVSPTHSLSNVSSYSQNYDTSRPPAGSEPSEVTLTDHDQVVTHRAKNISPSKTEERSVDSGIGSNRTSGNFNKMKHLLEKRMGLPVTGQIDDLDDSEEIVNEKTPQPSPPSESTRKFPPGPPPVPRRMSSKLTNIDGTDGDDNQTDEAPPATSSLVDSVTTPIVTSPSHNPLLISNLDMLQKTLDEFNIPDDIDDDDDDDIDGLEPSPLEEEQIDDIEDNKTDQLLADIDDMLADLNDHLDVMIPGSNN